MNNNKNPDVDLYECFEYYGNLYLMTGDNQMNCNICNSLCDALYGTLLYSAPNYLIINLNIGKGDIYKCNVNFPEQLNIFNFVTYKHGNTVFELYAVICHLGPSSMSGHFVSYCKHKKNKNSIYLMMEWFLFVKINLIIKKECLIFYFIKFLNYKFIILFYIFNFY